MLLTVVVGVACLIAGVLIGRRHPAEASVLAAIANKAKQKAEGVVGKIG